MHPRKRGRLRFSRNFKFTIPSIGFDVESYGRKLAIKVVYPKYLIIRQHRIYDINEKAS